MFTSEVEKIDTILLIRKNIKPKRIIELLKSDTITASDIGVLKYNINSDTKEHGGYTNIKIPIHKLTDSDLSILKEILQRLDIK